MCVCVQACVDVMYGKVGLCAQGTPMRAHIMAATPVTNDVDNLKTAGRDGMIKVDVSASTVCGCCLKSLPRIYGKIYEYQKQEAEIEWVEEGKRGEEYGERK